MGNPTTDYLEGFELNASRGGWSEDAFHCSKCPKQGCPLWWKLVWERSDEAGVVREHVSEGCGAAMAPALMVRLLVGQAFAQRALEERTSEIVQKQDDVKRGVGAVLRGILATAAKASGNPVAIQVAPHIPKIAGAFRRLLLGKRK
jgi:hypothetical protein